MCLPANFKPGWMQAGEHQRGHAGAQGIHECMCASTPESVMCMPTPVTFHLFQSKQRGLSCLYSM